MCYVAGLSIYTTENGLSEAFSQYGQVVEGILKFTAIKSLSMDYLISPSSHSFSFAS
jgi:cold-inducible RNA-binding protein